MQALSAAADDVGDRLRDYPEAEGRLRYSIARVYARLGRFDAARPHAVAALLLARDNIGFDNSDRAAMQRLLSEIDTADRPPGRTSVRQK